VTLEQTRETFKTPITSLAPGHYIRVPHYSIFPLISFQAG